MVDTTVRKWSQWLNLAAGLAVTAGVFGYLFTHITWAEVRDLIVKANRGALLVFLAFSMTQNLLRTFRYRAVLKAGGHVPGFFSLFLVVIVRGLFVDLLPARLGELVYVYLLRTRLAIPLGAAAASFALVFVFDIMAIAPLIVVAALWIGAASNMPVPTLVGGGLFLLAATAALVYFMPALLRLAYACSRLARPGPEAPPHRFRRWVSTLAAATHFNVRKARRSGVAARLLGLSMLVRVCKYAALYTLFYALTYSYGYRLADLPFPKMFLGFCSAELAASLPISGIGGFGAYEGTWTLVFTLLGFPENIAMLTSVAHHLLTQCYGYLLGITAVLLLLLPVFRIDRRRRAAAGTGAPRSPTRGRQP